MFNIEYRFTILKSLKGGLFWDMGNIWVYNEELTPTGNPAIDEQSDLLKLVWNNLVDQIAMSPGFGIRYDFGFFVFRLDAGIPFFDPRLPSGHRLTLKNPGYFGFNYKPPYETNNPNSYDKSNYTLNLAIGYPF
jgi:outer membrane protein assembly factor BamA